MCLTCPWPSRNLFICLLRIMVSKERNWKKIYIYTKVFKYRNRIKCVLLVNLSLQTMFRLAQTQAYYRKTTFQHKKNIQVVVVKHVSAFISNGPRSLPWGTPLLLIPCSQEILLGFCPLTCHLINNKHNTFPALPQQRDVSLSVSVSSLVTPIFAVAVVLYTSV